jgi:hypothetical protein
LTEQLVPSSQPAGRGGRILAIILSATVIIAVAGAAAVWLGLPGKATSLIRLLPDGPRSAGELQARLVEAPPGTSLTGTTILDIQGEASRLNPTSAAVDGLRERQFRWSVVRDWNGADGSKGSLRLAQFHTGQAALTEAEIRINELKSIPATEEWPAAAIPTAAILVRDSTIEGVAIRAIVVKGTVVAEVELVKANVTLRAVAEDLIRHQHEKLPTPTQPQTVAPRDARQPPDLRTMPLPMPTGGQKVIEFGRRAAPFRVPPDGQLTLAQVSQDFDDANAAMAWLEGLHFRKAVYAAWTTNTRQIYVTLFQFGGSQQANEYVTNQIKSENPQWSKGPIDQISGGQYFFSNREATILFAKGDIAVGMTVYDSTPFTAARLTELAHEQHARLP